jgi:hypothetical protein
VYSVAHPLRLDYVGLKERLDGAASPQKKVAFVELIADHPATLADCALTDIEQARTQFEIVR